MVVTLGSVVHKVRVRPGPEGQKAFQLDIRRLFNIPSGIEFDVGVGWLWVSLYSHFATPCISLALQSVLNHIQVVSMCQMRDTATYSSTLLSLSFSFEQLLVRTPPATVS